MDFFIWVQVLTICLIGAVSPGPSLAMVVKNTLNEGKKQGSLTALGHGLGIFFYAALVVSGLGIALSTFPELEIFFSFAGIVLLFLLGFSTLINSSKAKEDTFISQTGSFFTGFLIAFLNPKIATFFLAVFSPLMKANMTLLEKIILILTAGTVDALWYLLIVFVFAYGNLRKKFMLNSIIVDKVVGCFLLSVAMVFLYRVA